MMNIAFAVMAVSMISSTAGAQARSYTYECIDAQSGVETSKDLTDTSLCWGLPAEFEREPDLSRLLAEGDVPTMLTTSDLIPPVPGRPSRPLIAPSALITARNEPLAPSAIEAMQFLDDVRTIERRVDFDQRVERVTDGVVSASKGQMLVN